MSAETLRAAAALMRERAGVVPPSPWEPLDEEFTASVNRVSTDDDDPGDEVVVGVDLAVAEHIASWHPAVALAVADLLDSVAAEWIGVHDIIDPEALAVARAYLGESA